MAAATAKATSVVSSVATATTTAPPPSTPRLVVVKRRVPSPCCSPPLQSLSLRDDDFCSSSDELKVFTEEGEEEDKEQLTNEELLEEKSSLIQETELAIKQERIGRIETARRGGNSHSCPGSPYEGFTSSLSLLPPPSPYHPYGGNGPSTLLTSNSHMVRSTGSPLSPSFLYNDSLGSPPPAHIGGIPYSLADPGLRSLYSMPPHASYPYSLMSTTDSTQFSTCQLPRYGSLLSPSSLHCGSNLGRFEDNKQQQQQQQRQSAREKKQDRNHIKKPLNAFMLYMKEMRPKIVAECTLKESAAINQILGRRWHGLSREEQAKYYEMARKERQLHMQMYPGWSARDNYAQNKKKKRKRMMQQQQQDKSGDAGSNATKKCRSKYGLDNQDFWCKPCNSTPSSSSSSSSPAKEDSRLLKLSPHHHHLQSHHQQSHLQGEDTLMDMHLNNNCSSGHLTTMDTILFTSASGIHGQNAAMHQFLTREANGSSGALLLQELQESKLLAAAAAAVGLPQDAATGGGENGEQSPKYISL